MDEELMLDISDFDPEEFQEETQDGSATEAGSNNTPDTVTDEPTENILKAEDATQQILLDYFEENASDALKEKVRKGKKTIAGAFSFITGEARKQTTGNAAMIDDDTVYGWLMHYFEEDSIDFEKKAPVAKVKASSSNTKKKGTTKPSVVSRPVDITPAVDEDKKDFEEMDIFDIVDIPNPEEDD